MPLVMMTLEDLLSSKRRRRELPPPAVRRLLRERRDLTQLDIARILGVDRVSVSRYEAGTREPRGEVLERYLEVLDRLAQDD